MHTAFDDHLLTYAQLIPFSGWQLPVNSLPFIYWEGHSVAWNIPLASLFRSAVPVVLHPGFLCTCLLAVHMILKSLCFKLKALFLATLNISFINIISILMLSPKYSTVPAIENKINPSQLKPGQLP